MAADDKTWFEWMRGKRTRDIELPAEEPADPRLSKGKGVLAGFKTAATAYDSLKDKKRGVLAHLFEDK